jgi:hypothetical protein
VSIIMRERAHAYTHACAEAAMRANAPSKCALVADRLGLHSCRFIHSS